MKSIVFYCHARGRAALVKALIHLGLINRHTTLKEILGLPWWRRIAKLPPGQLLEIGYDQNGYRVFVLWVDKDKQLIPRLAASLSQALHKQADWQFVDALPKDNGWTSIARVLSAIAGNNYLSHRLFLLGITKLPKALPT